MTNPPDAKSLQMLLHGSLLACIIFQTSLYLKFSGVNGGPLQIGKIFLNNESNTISKYPQELVEQLEKELLEINSKYWLFFC